MEHQDELGKFKITGRDPKHAFPPDALAVAVPFPIPLQLPEGVAVAVATGIFPLVETDAVAEVEQPVASVIITE